MKGGSFSGEGREEGRSLCCIVEFLHYSRSGIGTMKLQDRSGHNSVKHAFFKKRHSHTTQAGKQPPQHMKGTFLLRTALQ